MCGCYFGVCVDLVLVLRSKLEEHERVLALNCRYMEFRCMRVLNVSTFSAFSYVYKCVVVW